MKQVILIIDDDGDTLDILGYLAVQPNIEVVLRSNLIPLSEIQQLNPNLILLDEWIGGKKGSDLCLQVKDHPGMQDIPIILVSAAPNLGQIALESCADGCIAKPFDIDEIQEVIESYLCF